jgi:hypothetical protein
MIFPGIEMRSPYQLMQALVMGQDLFVQDPVILTAAGLILPAKRLASIRTIMNVGTIAAMWRIGGTPTTDSFHGVLGAGTNADDGYGSIIDLSRFRGDVYVAPIPGAGTFRVVAFQALSEETQA